MITLISIAIIILLLACLIYIVLSERIRNKNIEKIEQLNKDLDNYVESYSKLMTQYGIIEKQAKGAEEKLKAVSELYKVNKDEFEKCLNSIAKAYTVTNKNKMILIKFLFYNLMHQNVDLDNLKMNHLSPSENANVLKQHLFGDTKTSADECEAILNSVLSLILYNRKK